MSYVDRIDTVLATKALKDLKRPDKPVLGSTIIDPTPAMIKQALNMLRDGESYKHIQATVKLGKMVMTFAQIKTLKAKWLQRLQELQAAENSTKE